MSVRDLSIGELAERAGCTVQIIRHYEKIGLLPETRRTSGNRRIYSEDQALRLVFIRHSRELGFSQDDVRTLLTHADQSEASCEDVARLAEKHLEAVRDKLATLQALENSLDDMIHACHGGRIEDCRIVKALANNH